MKLTKRELFCTQEILAQLEADGFAGSIPTAIANNILESEGLRKIKTDSEFTSLAAVAVKMAKADIKKARKELKEIKGETVYCDEFEEHIRDSFKETEGVN